MKSLLQVPISLPFSIDSSTVRLLRIPFSFFLSPVYFFALSQLSQINWTNAGLIFIIYHFFIYPASNGYNSYMDRDTESIGGLEKPPPPSRQLYLLTIVLDITGVLLSGMVGWQFTLFVLSYIGFSKTYSYRGIRIKKYPYLGWCMVALFQGGVIFWSVYFGSNAGRFSEMPWQGIIISALLVGGSYPLTQIYQHRQDIEDGVVTISYKLGYTRTFIFCATVYLAAAILIVQMFLHINQWDQLIMIGIFFIPVVIYFGKWYIMVRKDIRNANYANTMNMNWLAAWCTNISFFVLILWNLYRGVS